MNILFEIVRAETKSPLRFHLREVVRKRNVPKLWRVTPEQASQVEAWTKKGSVRFNEILFERVLNARRLQGEKANESAACIG